MMERTVSSKSLTNSPRQGYVCKDSWPWHSITVVLTIIVVAGTPIVVVVVLVVIVFMFVVLTLVAAMLGIIIFNPW
jgi:hypothetical protein